MKFKLFLLSICFISYGTTQAQIGRLALSPLQTLHQKIAKTDITITYSRPAKRGRDIFGGLEPFDKIWRTGANRNTKIEFSEDVIIGGTRLEKGTYAILTKPNPKNWEVYFYTDTHNWEVPEPWETDKIAAQINVPTILLAHTVQSLTIGIDDITNEQCVMSIMWDKTKVAVPITLTTEEQMSKIIEDVLNGPDEDDYYLAAQYRMESGENLEEGLTWINKAIELRPKAAWWDYRIKAMTLLGLERKSDVKPIAVKGLELAKKRNSAYAIKEFERILSQCEK